MGKNLATVSKRTLYPIERDEFTANLLEVVVAFRHSNGSYDLRRNLTAPERSLLERRRNFVVANLAAARGADFVDDVLDMLSGFGSGQGVEAAQAIATQYISVLSGLPAFAIKRACRRWALGEVKPEEVGEKALSRSFAPSAAQVRIVAEEIVKPHMQEATRINRALAATAPPPSTEERAKIAPKIRSIADETIKRLGSPAIEDLDRVREADARHRLATLEFSKRTILREYEAAGLEPPEGALCSLATLLSIGWSISETSIKGVVRRELIPPAAPDPKKRRARQDYDQNT